jgi:hypothetical protein
MRRRAHRPADRRRPPPDASAGGAATSSAASSGASNSTTSASDTSTSTTSQQLALALQGLLMQFAQAQYSSIDGSTSAALQQTVVTS